MPETLKSLSPLRARRIADAASRGLLVVLVSLLSLGLALVVAEYATRWMFRGVTTTSDNRGYFSQRWSQEAVTLNEQGFREREFSAVKTPGVYRVAVVGDSFAFGNGIPAASRFSDVMQQSLPPGVEVLNFGIPGNNTPEHADSLRTKIMGYQPDFVLVQWFVNDVEGGSSRGRPSYRPLLPFPELHERLYSSSAFYTLLNAWWTRRQMETTMAGSYADYMRQRFRDSDGEDVRRDRQAMRAVVSICRDYGVEVGFVLFPDSGYNLGVDYPFGYLHDRVLDFCGREGLVCADLRPALAAVKDRRELWVNSLDHHPGARANAIAAARIVETFRATWTARLR